MGAFSDTGRISTGTFYDFWFTFAVLDISLAQASHPAGISDQGQAA
jgi:hypothetical protein